MSKQDDAALISHGVETLIDQLRTDGIEQGRSDAEKIVSEAKSKAEWIVKQAQEEATQFRTKAKQEAEKLERSSQEALETATRDALLSLKAQLTQLFTREVKRLIGESTRKKELLEKMILEVVGQGKKETSKAKHIEVILPREVIGIEELSQDPEALEKGELTEFLRLITRKLGREGITFGVAKEDRGGLRVKLKDKDIELDFSDQAIAEVLLQHLQPRFRALLEGIVK